MDVLFVSGKYGSTRRVHFGWPLRIALLAGSLLVLSCAAVFGYTLATGGGALPGSQMADWQLELKQQRELVDTAASEAGQEIDALTVRMAELQARLLRLDALGEQLARMANIEDDEFDFSEVPALGGPELELSGDTFREPGFIETLHTLSEQIDHREQQLQVIGMLMGKQDIQRDVFL